MTRVLVTGGAGFIGSNLVAELLERGDEVRVLDNFSTGSRANLGALGREVEVVEGDLRSYERVHTAVRGTEVVFHQGALGSVPRSVQDPLTSTAVNVEGTLNVLLAARDEGIRRVVAASSSSVYGDGGTFPRVETQAPNPISPYAVAKLAAERFCVSFTRVYGIETVALRYFNVFGPRQDPSSQYAAVVPRFIRLVADGEPVTVHGDGEQSRDFTYVENVVRANLLAADSVDAAGRVLNVATGGSETVNALADTIGRLLDRPVEKVHGPGAGRRCARVVGRRDGGARRDRLRARRRLPGRAPAYDRRDARQGGSEMTHAFGSIDELGEGYGFRKVRRALGVDAFGVNVIVMPPRYEGFHHYHDQQDELYFVHAGTARVEVEGEERLLGPGGLVHVTSTTERRVSNAGDDDLVMLVVGGKGGYVERDGHLVDEADVARRSSFGSG